MDDEDRLRAALGSAVSGTGGAVASADRLCHACVELLKVDGASISLTLDGQKRGTFGASSDLGRHLDELQFTLGEGPCLETAFAQHTVLVDDMSSEPRWPAFS